MYLVTRVHFRSRDKDGGYTIRPAVSVNTMLQYNTVQSRHFCCSTYYYTGGALQRNDDDDNDNDDNDDDDDDDARSDARKNHSSMFDRTGVTADGSFTLREWNVFKAERC